MNKQNVVIGYEVENSVVKKVSHSYIFQPKVMFKGGEIKWHQDTISAELASATKNIVS